MSITIHKDLDTWRILDEAVEELAHRRDLPLTRSDNLLSVLVSLRNQLHDMIEQAITESDIGFDIDITDIAGILDITHGVARERYLTH